MSRQKPFKHLLFCSISVKGNETCKNDRVFRIRSLRQATHNRHFAHWRLCSSKRTCWKAQMWRLWPRMVRPLIGQAFNLLRVVKLRAILIHACVGFPHGWVFSEPQWVTSLSEFVTAFFTCHIFHLNVNLCLKHSFMTYSIMHFEHLNSNLSLT